jgi:formate dehydrogenase major subunit
LCSLAEKLESKGFVFENADDILSEVVSIIQQFPEKIGSFKLFPLQYTASSETTDMDYPLVLTAERDLYAGGILSEKTEGLRVLRQENHVSINPKDADDFEIADGETIRVISRHGSVETGVRLARTTPVGLAVMKQEGIEINQLLKPALDAISRIPEMKICAVRLEKIKKRSRAGKSRGEVFVSKE